MKINSINPYLKLNSIMFGNEVSKKSTNNSDNSQIDDFSPYYYKPFTLKEPFDSISYLNKMRYEIAKVERFNEHGSYLCTNNEAIKQLQELDDLSLLEKKNFIQAFCEETGFPDFKEIKKKAEKEITNQIHKLSKSNNFDVCFIGYDKNCSLGRGTALPGSDCDALFMIIDEKGDKPSWFSGAMRWQFKDGINQRILSTPANSLPEVLSVEYIEQGLEISKKAFEKAGFTSRDLKHFQRNLKDSSNDFVKSGEFNIRLTKHIPNDENTRTQAYKTAMLVELLRDGIILENNFSDEFIGKIKQSPLYKYSNLIKQQGFENSKKEKYQQRKNLALNFKSMSIDEQFSIVKDMLHFSFQLKDIENKQYFTNTNASGENVMGNIEEMYKLVQHIQ